ncbi:hypothetical protein WJX77_011258 [Trebouxia sp. C0004]
MHSDRSAPEGHSVITPDLSPAEEARKVIDTETRCHQAEIKEPAFLIAMSWWNAWTSYSGFTLQEGDAPSVQERQEHDSQPPRPSSIDNRSLVALPPPCDPFSSEKQLKPDLLEGTDYKLVFESTWKLLHQWYGGEPAFVRQWVGGAQPYVEIYALQLIIMRSSDNKEANLFIKREAKKSELKTQACQLMDLKEADVCMWDYYSKALYANMEDQLDEGVTGLGNALNDKQYVLLEEKDARGNFAMKIKKDMPATYVSSPLMLRSGRLSPPTDTFIDARGRGHGLAGLSNLGNTCFMNSSIQSLAHTVPLMRKFLRKKYESDINKDNPLGMNGELAEAFGSLMDKLWKGDTASVSPSSFKYQLGKFAPQFQGYGQQDSQELLAFLLDGLHEDLNRIKRKPYIEEKDVDGRPDEEVAKEAWQNYRKRNDSTIVDHFQGLYKSTLICPMGDCQYHSIKFDPFMYLSLPLPDRRTRSFEVTVVHVDGSKAPTCYTVAAPITGKVKDLYEAVAKEVCPPGVEPQKVLLLAEYDTRHSLTMHIKASEALSTVQTSNGPGFYSSTKPLLLAYHYASQDRGPHSGKRLLVYHRQRQKRSRLSTFPGGEDFTDKFAPPMVLFLAQEQAQQLVEHTRKVEIDSAPSWTCFEYVLDASSSVNAMLETALRPFKRPRHDEEGGQASADSEQGRRVHGRLASPSNSDATMADAAAAPSSNGVAPAGTLPNPPIPPGLHYQDRSSLLAETAASRDKGSHGTLTNGSDHTEMEEVHSSAASGANGLLPELHQNGIANNAGDGSRASSANDATSSGHSHQPSTVSKPVVNTTAAEAADAADSEANEEKMDGPPLKRMSWMESAGNGEPATNGHRVGTANGAVNGATDAADWEDVPDRSTPSPTMFAMDGDQDSQAGQLQPNRPYPPSTLPGPPSLKANPVIPAVQPFNMFADQQTEQHDSEQGEQGEAEPTGQVAGKKLPPYTLKVANLLGDVRLQNCPSPEGQDVLYFTAQWEHDGGGVYDIAKFTQPEEDESVRRASGVASTSARQAVGLDACLQAFQTAEELEAEDSWFCSKCKRHVQANKKLDLWAVPEVLVVHLKRFFFTRARRDKLDVQVDFPLENWDLSAYLPHHQDVPPVYDLYAVSNHFGGMGGGHYNAYCKMPDGKWWCFDDSHVHAVDKNNICSSSAYVLFYRRRHEAQQDTGDLLADINMKSEAEDADTVMSEGGNENSFASANHGDSPDWATRPLIQATQLQDTATHDINNDGLEEGEHTDLDEHAAKNSTSLYPATTAEGGIFFMEDTNQQHSAADRPRPTLSESDISMAAASHEQSADAGHAETGHAASGEAGTSSSFRMDASPMDLSYDTTATEPKAEALTSGLRAGVKSKATAFGLPDSLGIDVGDEAAGDADADSNAANDGDTSEPGSLRDISDDDLINKDEEHDITAGYELIS